MPVVSVGRRGDTESRQRNASKPLQRFSGSQDIAGVLDGVFEVPGSAPEHEESQQRLDSSPLDPAV